MIRSLSLVVALLLVACQGCRTPAQEPVTPPPAPLPAPDPSTVVVVSTEDAGPPVAFDAGRLDVCAKMCRHRRAIRCPDGDPTPAGTPCETLCRTNRAQPAARLTGPFLACLTAAPTCEASCAR